MANAGKEIPRFQDFLQQQGQKLTTERTALVREIFSIHYHFEADELLFKMKEKSVKISRATVYRTLELLVKSGHGPPGPPRRGPLSLRARHRELAPRSPDLHGLRRVIEFHDPELLEQRQMAICEKKKFTPTFHNLQILGVCDSCRRKGQFPDSPDRVQMIGPTRLRKVERMLQALIIVFREGFESFLTVAIIFAYLKKTGRNALRPAVWWGIALSVFASFGLGFLLQRSISRCGKASSRSSRRCSWRASSSTSGASRRR